MQLSPAIEIDIFKALSYKSALEVGLQFGLDQHYKDKKAVRNAVTAIANKVKKSPEKYGITPEVVALVTEAQSHRSLVKAEGEVNKPESEIQGGDIKTIVTGVRDKAWRLIDRKLTRAGRSNKTLDAISFRDLGTLAGISFDKSQIISGQATEHVALMGKIEGNINPSDAIALVLQMREKNVADKQTK